MPQILTMTRNQGETDEEFAARIAAQSSKFFSGSESESTVENADTPTDEPAESETPEEEPVPSA